MTTFSQLVDKMVLESKRPDLRTEIATYLNQTLRELHMEPQRGNVIFYRDNFKEDLLTSGVDTGFYWDLPDPAVFQGVGACRFDSVWRDGEVYWAHEIQPGRNQRDNGLGFYRSGTRIFFTGYGGVNATISLGWYEYTKSRKYYASQVRPAQYDIETGWEYADAYDVNDATREAARNLTSNWILLRWDMVVEEGLRAKIYKRLTDTERARTSYSMYSTLRQGLASSETADLRGS